MANRVNARDLKEFGEKAALRLQALDLMPMPATSRTLTDEGFLRAPAVIGRTGCQDYLAGELGLTDRPVDSIVTLYRPPSEVFSPATLASFSGQTVTDNHPPDDVSSENWDALSVGDVSTVTQSGETMLANLLTVRSADTVSRVVGGKSQLSCGYSFALDMTPGTDPVTGKAYDGVQRDIRGNHIAIVDLARGGPVCRIADRAPGVTKMALRKLVLDGVTVGDVEEAVATLAEKLVGDAKKAATDAATARDAALAQAKTADAALTAATEATKKTATDHASALAELKAKVLDAAQLDVLVEERTNLIADAKALHADIVVAGKDAKAIRLEVLKHVATTDSGKEFVTKVVGDLDKAEDVALGFAFKAATVTFGKNGTDASTARDAATADAVVGKDRSDSNQIAEDSRADFMDRLKNGPKAEANA